jgi:hypothetical protein
MDHAALEASRLVDDSLEQARDRFGAQRPLNSDTAHMRQNFLLAVRLIHLDALLLLQAPDFADAARPLV